ncbi:MAG: hypothetical protein PHR35_13795 [Kiritimatiellae bacterium]|nr:hypothetical protein [Kiritimatiellia bacterium]
MKRGQRSEVRGQAAGSALIVTLGLLAILALLVFALAFSARTERFAARHGRDRVVARQYVDLALSQAMEQTDDFTRGQGNPARLNRWYGNDAIAASGAEGILTPNAFTTIDTGAERRTDGDFFSRAVTNLIPSALWSELSTLKPHWLPIVGVDEDKATITGTNGYIAYAVVNCSGFLDVHALTSNQTVQLQHYRCDIDDATVFIMDRARDTAPGAALTNYISLQDLTMRNRGLLTPVACLFTTSFDPGPDVTVTNGAVYSNRDVALTPKLDLNSWTNGFKGSDMSDSSDLSAHYTSAAFRDGWLCEASNRFAAIGFAAPEALAWNLVNFMDADRVPQSDHPRPWQQPWPVEDVPLINEIAVAMVPTNMVPGGHPNHYAPAIELWYPFATNVITLDDEAELVVAIYTNWPSDRTADDVMDLPESSGDAYGTLFVQAITNMEHGTDREFMTATMPSPYVAFPVAVLNAEQDAEGPYVMRTVNGVTYLVRKESAGITTPPMDDTFFRVSDPETQYLPLGVAKYATYVPTNHESYAFVRTTITVTNEIRLLARVRLGDNWVDEAMGYDPDDPARSNLVAFLEPCGYEVNDPRRNGYPSDWNRYEASDMSSQAGVDGESSGGAYTCSLSGATNRICDPWHMPFGQGLPLVHFNRPVRSAGDLGYLQQPESRSLGVATVTSLWQSICLADPRLLGTNNAGFAFSAGSVLEFFTARGDNTPVRGLVHYSTCWTNVVRALMADLTAGWGAGEARLDDVGIDWMTRNFFASQELLYGGDTIPIGPGDMCFGLGLVPDFQAAADAMNPAADAWHWQGSLGNDLKEDLLRGLAERISFRQHVFVVVMAGRTVTPSGNISADQRAVAVVLRDAYSGRWRVHSWEWLDR